MKNQRSNFALICAALVALTMTGCAHVERHCEPVEKAEEAMGVALQALDERGVVKACQAGNDEACNIIKGVLKAYDSVYLLYKVCFDVQ